MEIEDILYLPETADVREQAEEWISFLNNEVNFNLKNSKWHTVEHAMRVILFALMIGHREGLSTEELDLLGAAAAFHDSRREDDSYDVGHGKRAAVYYRDFCQANNLAYSQLVSDIMTYHDRDDELGIEVIEREHGERGVFLYQIFKDGDALDRHRLGPKGLDVNYLRTEASKELNSFARKIWQNNL